MIERRSDYISLEKDIQALTMLIGNLGLTINEVKVTVKELAAESKLRDEKLETRDENLANRINVLESYKDKVIGIVSGTSIGGTTLVIALQEKFADFFRGS